MNEQKKTNACQSRLLLVIEALSGHEVFGTRLVDLAKAVDSTQSTVLRDLGTLEAAGWAQQMEDGKWRLGAKPIQVLTNFHWGLQSASQKVAEVQHNYTRQTG